MIVKNSEILYKELTKSRISIDILLEKLRKKVDDMKKVTLATWEPNDKISVFYIQNTNQLHLHL